MSTVVIAGRGYGRRVGLQVAPEDLNAVRTHLPFWWIDDHDGGPERTWTVPPGAPCEHVIRELELWVAEQAADVVFVHAGVVVLDGRALLLPGRSMSGKTTLVAALLRAGAQYLSDEYAVLDADGRVHPYPRPLSVRTAQGRSAVPAAALGADVPSTAVRVGAVAVLTYREGAPWAPRALSESAAVLHLLDNTVGVRASPERSLEAVCAAVEDAHLIAGDRDDAEATVAHLRRLAGPRTHG